MPSVLATGAALLAVVLYLGATLVLYRRLLSGLLAESSLLWTLIPAALAFHLWSLAPIALHPDGVGFSIGGALSMVTWVAAALLALASLRRRLVTLGLILFPASAVTVLLGLIWSGPPQVVPGSSAAAVSHLVVAILAYGLLSLAAAHAVILTFQERLLHGKRPIGLLSALPPMETMETVLFQLIGIGFALLTVTLISGLFFSEALFGRPLVFNHHVVLSVVAWLCFGTLLGGRTFAGWRGPTAVKWTIASFVVLALAYFGTRIVLEVVLQR